MADAALDVVIRYLRRLAVPDGIGALTDAVLLDRFVHTRDEAAFEVLVWRHGGLVYGLCKKLLHNEQDAEDAFQAVFLTLSRKPPAVLKNESLAGWLHQVACRIAMRLRAQTVKRRARERTDLESFARVAESRDMASVEDRELWGTVIEELHRLPDRYRRPVISCYLQGKTHVEAAREVDQPAGSMSRVLAKACKLLNARLTRRGVCLSAGGLAALLADRSWAAVPPNLVQPVVSAAMRFARGLPVAGTAARLAQAMIQSMLFSKVKITVGLLMVFCALTGGAVGLASRGKSNGNLQAQPDERAGEVVQQVEQKKSGVDAFGDPLPPGAIARLGTIRWRHGAPINCLAVSPDGALIASGGSESGIHLWEVGTGKQLGILLHQGGGSVESLAFSPNGKIIASTGRGGSAAADLWNVDDRKWLRACEFQRGQNPSGVSFSPDGTTLAVTSSGTFPLCFYDITTGGLKRSFAGHTSGVHGGTFASDGRTFASAGSDGTVRIWDSTTGQETASFNHPEGVVAVALDSNQRWLASRTTRGVYLWDRKTAKQIWQFKESSGNRSTLAFSPDGKFLSSEGNYPGGGVVWEVPSGKEAFRLDWEQVNCIAFAPNGHYLVMGGTDGVIRIWDVVNQRQQPSISGQSGRVCYLAFGPDGKTLLTYANGTKEPWLWNTYTGKEIRRFPVKDLSERLLAASPDGKHLLTEAALNGPTLIDTATGKESEPLYGHKLAKGYQYAVEAATFAPDSKTVATGGHDGTVQLWYTAFGLRPIKVLAGHESLVRFVRFTADGKTLVSRTNSGMTHIWDVATGHERRRFGTDASQADALSPDGKFLAIKCNGDKAFVIRIYEIATGKLIHSIEGVRYFSPSLVFSPDSKTLAFGQVTTTPTNSFVHVICLWELATGRERGRLEGHEGSVSDLAFSPNGKVLASGSADTTTLIWDLATAVKANGPKTSPLSRTQIEGLWTDLAADDAAKAYRALWQLAGDPVHTMPFLERVLKPVQAPDPVAARRMIGDLNSNRSATREKAMAELEKLGEVATPLLRQALAGETPAEVRRRVQQLIEKVETVQSADQIRSLRAIEVLENLGTPHASKLLESLAGGVPEARLTREAAAARGRIRVSTNEKE